MSESPGQPSNPVPPLPPGTPPPYVPPTWPGQLGAYPRQASWPGVIGVIAIVLGALGLLTNLWGVVGPFTIDRLMPTAGGPADAITRDIMEKWKWTNATASAVGVGISALLLAWGIGMTKRSPSCVRLAKIWAGLNLIATLFGTALGYFQTDESFSAANATSVPAGAPSMAVMKSLTMVFVFCGGILGAALPIFVLVWLSREKVKAEITTWGTRVL